MNPTHTGAEPASIDGPSSCAVPSPDAEAIRRIGLIGIGNMGKAMATNLLAGGFVVTGFDPVVAARNWLGSNGGTPMSTIDTTTASADILLTSLPNAAALKSVAETLAGSRSGAPIVIETSTLPLNVKEAAAGMLAKVGKTLLDCGLSGTSAQAVQRDLVVLGSGERSAFDLCRPALEAIARSVKYLGAFGNGTKMKLVANHLVTIHNLAAAEALVLAEKAGLALEDVLDALGESAASSRMLQVRGPLMAAAQYAKPTMTIDLQLKDIGIIGRLGADLHVPMPLFSAAAPIYHAGSAQGRGGEDTAAIFAVLEAMAGLANPTSIAGRGP